MEKQRKTFLSYSSVNKGFAIRLARELKAEGFNIWLDQMDIPAGARWDREVEKALRESEIFMIILTPASVDSENVLDEIGYAIDKKKRFLPVLLEKCEIPLRLRRFQYADFTNKSFDEGLESAKELLRALIALPTLPRVEVSEAQAPAKADPQVQEEARPDRIVAPKKEKANRRAVQRAEAERIPEAGTTSTAASSTVPERKPVSGMVMIGIFSVVAVIMIALIGYAKNLRESLAPPTEEPYVEVPAPTERPPEEVPASTEEPTPEPPPEEAAPAELIELSLWYSYESGGPEEAALLALLDQAAIDLPNVTVYREQVPVNDIGERYANDVRAGGGPDIVVAPNDIIIRDYAREGLIVDITDQTAGRLDGYYQIGIDGMTLDGRLYGVPESLNGLVLWFKPDWISDPPADVDQLIAIASEGTPIDMGFDCYSIYGMFGAFGGGIFDSDWNVNADQTPAPDALYYLTELYAISSQVYEFSLYSNFNIDRFINEDFAAAVNGSWALKRYRDAFGDNLAVAALPAGPAGPVTPLLSVSGFFINPNSGRQDTDLELALYMTSASSQEAMMNNAGHVPARFDVAIQDPIVQSIADIFTSSALPIAQQPEMHKYFDHFCSLEQIYEEGFDPGQWVIDATAAANQ